MVYRTRAEIDFRLEDLPVMPPPRRVLMGRPDFFDVSYVINPHMAENVGRVDAGEAADEWRLLRRAYESLEVPAETVPAVEGLPDLVFAANQTFPFYDPRDGTRGIVLSEMHAPERRDEVRHFARFFRSQGYQSVRLPGTVGSFEGMGDALWHPGRHLVWGGYGFRTTLDALRSLSSMLEVPVIALRLVDERFYHLDTCLSLLDDHTAMLYPPAIDEEGQALVRHFFTQIVYVPEDEAVNLLACNAHSPDGRHVLIQKGSRTTIGRLQDAGFEPVEVETGEFLKSGGSVFCMKQMFW